jgi:hypothetical protein
MHALTFALLLFATSAGAQTFTRAEVAKLSPQELATRVLGGVALLGSAKEIKTYISPVAPTPPWLERVAITLPPTYLADYSLCMSNDVVVDFAPLDPDAKQHMFDSTYDPPTKISRVDVRHRYAAAASCENIPDADFFAAQSDGAAEQAMDAFKMFRVEADKPGSAVIACRDLAKENFCKPDSAKNLTHFEQVLSIQEDRHQDASITRTVILSVSNAYGESKIELWLTVEFAKEVKLARAELRHLWADPIP